MTTGHLVSYRNLSFLRDIYTHKAIDSRRELVVVLAAEHLDVNDFSGFAVRYSERSIADFTRFFAKNRPKQSFFRRKLRFTFRRNLAHENITGTNFRTDTNDAFLVQIAKRILRHVRNIAGNLFRPQFRIASVALILFNMNGSIKVAFYEILA